MRQSGGPGGESPSPAQLLDRASAARLHGDIEAMRAALTEAFEVARSQGDSEAMATAALGFPTAQQFGVHPGRLPALLHEAYVTATAPATRCRVAAALARSWAYGGDARRAEGFAREARRLAADLGRAELTADALDALLLVTWGPDDLSERVSLAAQLDETAAHLADVEQRLSAHLWRLTTAWECLDIVAVHRQLRALDILAAESGSKRVQFFAASRRAMHVQAVGDYALADELTAEATAIGAEVAEPDVQAVLHSLAADRAMQTGDLEELRRQAADWDTFGAAEGIASVLATAATLWLAAGEEDRAMLRARQIVAGGVDTIPRDVDFLRTVSSVVQVAAALGDAELAGAGAAALEPYAGRSVLNAGAVTFHGVVDDYLFQARSVLGDPEAQRWHDQAANAYRRIGAAWWLRRLTATNEPSATMVTRVSLYRLADGEGWHVGVGDETFELPDLKGLHYLHHLLARPGVEIDAAELSAAVAGHPGAAVARSDAGDVLDAKALAAYRRRLTEIDKELDEADASSDQAASQRLQAERDALVGELRSATGLGGRRRRLGSTDERARVAVRKAISGAIARIEARHAGLGRVLRDTIHTGGTCRYDPQPDRRIDWTLTPDGHLPG